MKEQEFAARVVELEAALDRVQIAATTAQAARDKALSLLRDLVDLNVCEFSDDGGCQAHGFPGLELGERCPEAEARELLVGFGLLHRDEQSGDDDQ